MVGYDTLHFRLNTRQAGLALPALTGIQTMPDKWYEGQYRFHGRIGNLQVSGDCTGIWVKGSLCKFHLGNNAEILTRQETGRAIVRLSDTIHLPMAEANVFRIDVGTNLVMKYSLAAYAALLGECPYLKKSFWANRQTVQYSNCQRAIIFYDKLADMARLHEDIPAQVQGRNLLRVEMRLLRKASKQLGKTGFITGSDLYDEVFYVKPIKKFQEQYFLVQKLRKEQAFSMNGQKEMVNSLAFWGLKSLGGLDVALGLIRAERAKGVISKETFKRLKDKVREIASIKPDESHCAEIQELDSKIKMAVNYYR